ncbi:MAG: hypothetical protein KDA84_26550, partial [Planctomycetaceae bacterium]|nr:hypothetical protein [Planctomycetaceae bacterium]
MSGNVSNNPAATPVRWWGFVVGFAALIILVLLWGIAGCGGSPQDPEVDPTTPTTPGQNDTLLKTAIDMMQPDRLGINAFPQQAANLLNQWRAIQVKTGEKKVFSPPLSEDT